MAMTVAALHGSVPTYLSRLVHDSDLPGHRSLRSAWTSRLLVPSDKLSTVGEWAFLVAGSTVWNNLPLNVTKALSLPTCLQL